MPNMEKQKEQREKDWFTKHLRATESHECSRQWDCPAGMDPWRVDLVVKPGASASFFQGFTELLLWAYFVL